MADDKFISISAPVRTVSSEPGTIEVYIGSNTDWTISVNAPFILDKTSGSGNDIVTITYGEWYAYSDRYILPFVSNGLETKDEFITQTHTVPWVVMDSRIKTIPASGGRIIVNNFYSNTNCDSVTLSTSVGTITPTEHIGKWGETTSIDYVLDIPPTADARTIVVTGSSWTSSGEPITAELKITQEGRRFSEIELNVDAAYHNEMVNVDLYGDWWVSSKAKWIQSDITDGTDPGSISLVIGGNDTQNTRTGYVYVYGEEHTIMIRVNQAPVDMSINPSNNAIPICRDIIYQESSDKVEYIVVETEIPGPFYTGCAYKYPDSDNVTIELNDLFSDQLRNHIVFNEGYQEMDGYFKKFGIQNKATGDGAIIYSYKSWEEPRRVLLNDPISNVIDPRQYLFINYLDAYNDCILYKNGEPVCEYGKKGGIVGVVPRTDAVCGEEVWYDVKFSSGDVLAVQSYVYKETNKNYALYYINAFGGWDSLAIRGNVIQTDNMQSQTYKNKTNGKVKYLNTITPTWQLYTDDMNDGSKMHHLLESTEVYLHNLESDEIVPVVITDSNCVYKTYANQGNTRFNYTINVEASNYKIRK